MKLTKSVFIIPKNLVPIFQEDHCLDVTEEIRVLLCTMLTLFKPWRHGKNLKEDEWSWDEAFTNYKFTPCQIELMKFFNICYECNDARDDYSKLLKQKNATDGVFPYWFGADDDEFDVIIMMVAVTLQFMKSIKQINIFLLAEKVNKE